MFEWDPRSLRYRDVRTGRYLSRSQVLRAMESTLAGTRRRIRDLAVSLRDGSVSLGRWQAEMRSLVKSVHLYNGALARGGWDQMSPADYGRLGPRLKAQYRFLDRFAEQVASGEQPLDGNLLRRADLYGQAGRGTYWRMSGEVHREAGFTEERNVLTEAEHCDGCLGETGRGWVPIGELVPVGDRDCKANDRCEIEFR